MTVEVEGPPTISVIVCTHDRTQELAAHLPAMLVSAARAPWPTELIIVDNAPSDSATQDLVRRSGVARYVQEPRKGLGNARNAGVAACRAPILLFVDDDVQVPETWVADMAHPLLTDTADIVAGEIQPGPGRDPAWLGPAIKSSLLLTGVVNGQPTHLIGASFGCKRAVVLSVPFDENLGAGSPYGSAEDVLFYEQAVAAGYRVRGCSTSPVIHNFDVTRLSRSSLSRAAENIGKSQAYIAHHWLGSRLRLPQIRIAVDRLRLLRWATRPSPVMTDDEWRRRIAIAHKRQLRAERSARR